MNICNDFKNRVIDFLEHRLSRDEEIKYEKHMQNCARCRREFAQVKKVQSLLDTDHVPLPPDEEFERILSRVRQQPLRLRSPFMKYLVRVFVPVCAAAAIIIFLFSRRQSPSIEIPVPVSVLLEDEDIAHLGLLGVIDGAFANELLEAGDHLPFILDETLDELTVEEKRMLIERVRKKYGYEIPG